MDSDTELELSLPEMSGNGSDVEDDGIEVEPAPEGVAKPSIDADLVKPPTAFTDESSFKPPPNPSIPQDLSLIMEMVAAHQVVGSLPPLDMAAAEKRRLVEQSMRDRKGKAKEDTPVPPPEDPSSSEESSSEEESSEEESSSDEDTENEGEPMTETTHQALKAKLDDLNGVTSLPKSESAASLVPPSPSRRIPLEMLDEDEEASGGPILSTNEAPLSVVPQPPMYELPKGEELSLAGEVVSWMRDRRVEAWVEKGKLEEEIKVDMETNPPPDGHMEDGEIAGEEAAMVNGVPESKVKILDGGAMDAKNEAPVALSPSHKRDNPSSSSSKPRFASAGTVVVRAMQSRPGSGRDGWLEEGSVLCWEDRRVLGTSTETFGPLTSPYYQIRLPPPPFPYPSPISLRPGNKVYYPNNPRFRTFVNMHAVRDPRFKGSDASNLYDEEIGEEEQEWSDDEAEAEAKRRRKHQRGGSRPFSDRSTPAPRLGGAPSLPQRPHFDYQPPESTYAGSETGSLYGGDEGASIYAESDAGSSAGGRGRPMPAPYDVDDTSLPARLIKAEPSSPRQEAGGRGRGRGRGDRGRGDRGRRGGGDFGPRRGGRPNDGGPRQDDRRSSLSNSSRPNSLPPRPMMNPRPEPPFQRQHQQWRPPQPPGSQQPFPRPPQPGFNPHMPMQPYHQNNIPSMPYNHHPFHPQQSPPPHFHPDEQYHPTQPSAGMSFRDTPPMTPPPMVMGQAQPPPQQTCPPPSPGVQAQSPHAPAINPRFAAQYQYQQMLNMGGFSGW